MRKLKLSSTVSYLYREEFNKCLQASLTVLHSPFFLYFLKYYPCISYLVPLFYCFPDADTGPQCLRHYGWDRQIHTDYRNPVKERGWQGPLFQWNRGPPPPLAWTGFYCFSAHITLKMVLIYYAHVHFRWLPFTENKAQDVPNHIKKGYLQM